VTRALSLVQGWLGPAIREEKVFGPEHPDTAVSLNNLAVLLQEQADLAGGAAARENARWRSTKRCSGLSMRTPIAFGPICSLASRVWHSETPRSLPTRRPSKRALEERARPRKFSLLLQQEDTACAKPCRRKSSGQAGGAGKRCGVVPPNGVFRQ
jgi:hypothetical protein